MLAWPSSDTAPLAWEVPEEGLFAPLRDLGNETGLRGQTLAGWLYGVRQTTPSLSLQFQDGRQISFFGSDHSWREFEVVQWTLDPGQL
ncbi:hypothetical protein [Deinococcus multiflagellatus]|uniref:Uncharacterized protein n=1 Tax=Deinococcus multiflagellatus TaxID=1656887 RepID=A0ABW1ZN70_9DEIO|nr:hypothetical protein [Deinococcus multiflagellatus]MBZ9712699.1 hypothetical protein [Deinococcus multiflagellatus]